MLRVNHHLQIRYITVPVLTLMSLGHIKSPRINNDYFCDTVNTGPYNYSDQYYLDDILWDGEGCGPTSTCCSLHSPPWFCKSLPQPTSDDLEIRLCGVDHKVSFEKQADYSDGFPYVVSFSKVLISH